MDLQWRDSGAMYTLWDGLQAVGVVGRFLASPGPYRAWTGALLVDWSGAPKIPWEEFTRDGEEDKLAKLLLTQQRVEDAYKAYLRWLACTSQASSVQSPGSCTSSVTQR